MRRMRIFIPRYDSVLTPAKRVITVAPMPPEKSAYALARYSRSPDSIRESIEWVRTHDSQKFLESFYFQYGHASIADLGHTVLCFEGISELAATEIEEEPLWDGQAKSSRYQDFSQSGFVAPRELGDEIAQACAETPDCRWELNGPVEPLAPTLARHADPDEHTAKSRADLTRWAEQNLPRASGMESRRVELLRPVNVPADIA